MSASLWKRISDVATSGKRICLTFKVFFWIGKVCTCEVSSGAFISVIKRFVSSILY